MRDPAITHVAKGDDIPVRKPLGGLQKQGLDRHDGIHATAFVLINQFQQTLSRGAPASEGPHGDYVKELEQLTTKGLVKGMEFPGIVAAIDADVVAT